MKIYDFSFLFRDRSIPIQVSVNLEMKRNEIKAQPRVS